LRECPNCHYVDPPYWRNRLFDYEVDICNIEDVFQISFDLYLKLVTAPKHATIFESPYCYRLTKTGWVYRIWESLFKVRGWSPQKYYDGAGSRASTLRKMNLKAYQGSYPHIKRENEKIQKEVEEIRSLLENSKH